jgi:ribonuclease-3
MGSISAGKDFNRLEYLGDSVLGMISAELLFAVEPSLDAGAMTKLRSHLVCRDQLVKFADQFDLISELKHNLTNNNDYESNLLADSFEAYIGAYYFDAGIGPVREFMQPLFKAALVSAQDEVDVADAKGKLQELLEPTGEKPEYRFSRSGADHQPTFEAEVWFFGECRGKGVSSSKKAAEKLAAHAALVTYKSNFFENLMKAEPI